MKEREMADAIDRLTDAIAPLYRLKDGSPGLLEEGISMLVTELRSINTNLGEISEAIRELSQQIGSEK